MAVAEDKRESLSQPLIRKLTSEKAVKAASRQSGSAKATVQDEVTVLNLSKRGIKTIESLEFPALRRLDLSGNLLTRLKLQGCPSVTYLQVANNELTAEGLEGVRSVQDLKVLNATGNKLKHIPSTVFGKFRQLQALVLASNDISEVASSWFNKDVQASLNTIVLSHNKVESLANSGLGRLTKLTKLSISHNQLLEIPDLSHCSALEELRASHNQVQAIPASLAKNTALRTLELGHNDIQDWQGVNRLTALSSLVQLSLAGNPICGGESILSRQASQGEQGAEGKSNVPGSVYAEKLRSLFPGLKVTDGKRTLLKKSHGFHDRKVPKGEGLGADEDRASGARKDKKGRMEEICPTMGQVAKGKGDKGRCSEGSGKEREGKAEGTSRGVLGIGLVEGEKSEMSVLDGKSKRKGAEEGGGVGRGKKLKKKRQHEEEGTVIKSAGDDLIGERQGETKVVPEKESPQDSTEEVAKAVKDKKAKKDSGKDQKKKKGKVKGQEAEVVRGSAVEADYSSAEELPLPSAQGKSGSVGVKVAGMKHPPGGGKDRSGVVAVVVKRQKRQRESERRGKSEGEHESGGKVGLGGGASREFTVEAMLKARGERETVGWGGEGVAGSKSAWD
ncbi:unnamed protein product [Choristocarpus tenellus]